MATIVIGIGNPIRTDDSVGIHVVRRVASVLEDRSGIAALECHVGGMRLMEAMIGYDRAILIDAIQSGGGSPGTIYEVASADLLRSRNAHSMHDGSLAVALELGRSVGLRGRLYTTPRASQSWGMAASPTCTPVWNLSGFSPLTDLPLERSAPRPARSRAA